MVGVGHLLHTVWSDKVAVVLEEVVGRVNAWQLGHDVSLLTLTTSAHVIITALLE